MTIHVKKEVAFGDIIKAVGNNPCLGDWNIEHGVKLNWSDGHVWQATIDVPVGKAIKFKV